MIQIKTIMEQNPEKFDKRVNEALAEGWYIVRRLANHDGFIAEMETQILTEKERTCENCKYHGFDPNWGPCLDCEDGEVYPSNWEPADA